jgi:hypothetical protein
MAGEVNWFLPSAWLRARNDGTTEPISPFGRNDKERRREMAAEEAEPM